MNLSFAGCGFLGIYHIGVACCFKQYAPHLLLDKIAGASAGAIAACCLLCDLPIGGMISDVLSVIGDARKKTLGPFSPSFDVQSLLREGLERFLPEDAHERVSGKLRVSLTRVKDFKNVIITDFDSREELLQALLASAFVPLFSGLVPPKFRGTRYMDGGFSDNLPTLDENTITVSPFCGESDICPRDFSSQLFHVNVANTSIELSKPNIYRLLRILYPPKPETLSKMCKQGFDDALKFLHRNNLMNCTNCLAVQSTFVLSKSSEDTNEYDDPECKECKECKLHSQEALKKGEVPETVMTIFHEAVENANKGLVNWLFKYRGVKLLSVLSLPYTIPFDVVYALSVKFVSWGPMIIRSFQTAVTLLKDVLDNVFVKLLDKPRMVVSSIKCQLNVTRYGDFNIVLDEFQETTRNGFVNFTVDLGEDLERHSLGDKILSRRSSLVIHKSDQDNVEHTIDQILKVTSQHDAVMAYYYMDDDNKVKVTEIFDVTRAETEAIFHDEGSAEEKVRARWRESNRNVDDSSDNSDRKDSISSELSDASRAEYNPDGESQGIFSDPESEWSPSSSARKETEETKSAPFGVGSDTRPESDQSGKRDTRPMPRKRSFVVIK